jgi:hypothetical protein
MTDKIHSTVSALAALNRGNSSLNVSDGIDGIAREWDDFRSNLSNQVPNTGHGDGRETTVRGRQ